jgi:hypothetical protein
MDTNQIELAELSIAELEGLNGGYTPFEWMIYGAGYAYEAMNDAMYEYGKRMYETGSAGGAK